MCNLSCWGKGYFAFFFDLCYLILQDEFCLFFMTHDNLLLDKARQAWFRSRAFYSGFQVGAAVLLEDGSIYDGFNIEADSSSVSICAERVAVAHAMLYSRAKIIRLAVIADTDYFISPCGLCRQFLSEFSTLIVIMANFKGDVKRMPIKDLIPHHFHRRGKKEGNLVSSPSSITESVACTLR